MNRLRAWLEMRRQARQLRKLAEAYRRMSATLIEVRHTIATIDDWPHSTK